MASEETPEPFPTLAGSENAERTSQDVSKLSVEVPRRSRAGSAASTRSITQSITQSVRERGSSFARAFANSNPPLGMWQATAEVSSKIPTLPEIRDGAFAHDGWNHEGQMEYRGVNPHEIHRRRMARTSSASTRTRKSTVSAMTPATIHEDREHSFFPSRVPAVDEVPTNGTTASEQEKASNMTKVIEQPEDPSLTGSDPAVGPDVTGTYPNGYRFPKKHTWTQSLAIGSKAFFRFACTPIGFVITIYGLNVVAWGAMIFFVLLNAAPALCHPSCNALNSPRKIWIEIDSQVLNGLFCVTGFGLIPWRFRDFYFLMRWRMFGNYDYWRKLAGVNRSWYRLEGSEQLSDDVGPPPMYNKKHPMGPESPPAYTEEEIASMERNRAIPLPAHAMPDPPLTGVRAHPTRPWLIDVVVWMYLLNTAFQTVLAAYMWHYNRFTRPSWATGFFISIGCVVAMVAGIVVFVEGSKIKKVEGIPVHEYDVFETIEEAQARHAEKEAKHHHHLLHHNSHPDTPKTPEITLERKETRKVKGHQWWTRH